MGEPRVRVSAILRWRGRILLLRHVKASGEVWLLPGGGVRSGESLVRALQRELGKTMVFVTHDIAEAFLLANRIALLKDGEMVLLGPPEELLRSQDPEARAFAEGYSGAQGSRTPA